MRYENLGTRCEAMRCHYGEEARFRKDWVIVVERFCWDLCCMMRAVQMISFYMPINSTRCSHIFHLRCMCIDLVSLDVDFSGRSNAELPSSYTSARAGECEYLFLSARIVVYDICSFQHSR